MADMTQDYIQQIKDDAARLTERRLTDQGVDFHKEREAEINAMEGVTQGTPLLQAVKLNPSEPGLANVQSLANHQGAKNIHAQGQNEEPTASSVASAEQSAKRGTNSTK